MITIYTHSQILAKIEKFCERYKFYADAADAMGCTKSQLTLARQGKQPPCPAILKAIGVQHERLFVEGKVDKKYLTPNNA